MIETMKTLNTYFLLSYFQSKIETFAEEADASQLIKLSALT